MRGRYIYPAGGMPGTLGCMAGEILKSIYDQTITPWIGGSLMFVYLLFSLDVHAAPTEKSLIQTFKKAQGVPKILFHPLNSCLDRAKKINKIGNAVFSGELRDYITTVLDTMIWNWRDIFLRSDRICWWRYEFVRVCCQ